MSRSNTIAATVPFSSTLPSRTSVRMVALIVLCGAIVACGFFFAARQHFSAMELGIKNSRLRKQLSDLEAENRRLSLAREVASSPMSIRKASQVITAPRINADGAVLASAKSPAKELTPDTEVRASLTRADEDKAIIASKVVKTALVKAAAKVDEPRTAKKAVEPKARQKQL